MHESPVRIFYVPAARPGRSYKLILQGLNAHPRVALVDDDVESDFVFYHEHAWDTSRRYPPEKLVFIDFHDHPYVTYPVPCLAYFKRSWSHPLTPGPRYAMGATEGRPPFVFPTAYSVMDEFVVHESLERDIELACLLRPNQAKRQRILDVVGAHDFGSRKTQIGAVDGAGRDVFDRAYLETLRRSRIVITANPDEWEGDSRLWEALANGALVFVDRMHTPMEHPLVGGRHCIIYDSAGIDEDPGQLRPMLDLVDYYLSHPDEADEIARQGMEHALLHHRAVDRVDAMLRTVEGRSAVETPSDARSAVPESSVPRVVVASARTSPVDPPTSGASSGGLTITAPRPTNGSVRYASRGGGTDIAAFLADFHHTFPPESIGDVTSLLEDRFIRSFYDPCFDIEGMTSVKKQMLLGIAAKHVGRDACYFEVGTYTGKSLVSAMVSAPRTRFYACDNFSLFKDTNSYEILMRNLDNHGLADRVTFFDDDFRNVLVADRIREPIGVYFYDGKHSLESQYDGIRLAEPLFAETALVIVDDWRFAADSNSFAQAGTEQAISESGRVWRQLLDLPARFNGDQATWWNGVAVFESIAA